ncbi:MAG: hypothetical protein OXC28_10645 [Defluviicoccus sp.]|nr:hypothetical protein [Defluviicoccus sp.]
MTRKFTVQVGYAGYYASTVTVEADTLDNALEKAIETANDSAAWKSLDHVGDSFVDAVCEGADADPWNTGTSLPIPDRFTEQGEPPVVTITDPAKPGGGIEVTRGRVLLRFTGDAGTVTSELRDPPHPPANKPLVTIRSGPGGRPEVTVTEGRARIRLLDQ